MSLKYEPSSEPLHIFVKQLFLLSGAQLCGAGGSAFPENGSKDAPEAVHKASFPGIAYIQVRPGKCIFL